MIYTILYFIVLALAIANIGALAFIFYIGREESRLQKKLDKMLAERWKQ